MSSMTAETRDIIDNYRASNKAQRMLISSDAMRRLFIAERIWKAINRIDMEEERIKGEME